MTSRTSDGASLYFHYDWARASAVVARPFQADDHVLVSFAGDLPGADVVLDDVIAALAAWTRVCGGDAEGGPAARETRPGERFRWLTAPRSTIIQPGPVHMGMTADPAAELERLVQTLVHVD